MEAPLAVGPLLTGLGGGLALFLYGMRKMTEALKVIAGVRMKAFLARVTTNRFTAALAGAGVTTIVQSSSVTTVLVVGFITSGLLTLSQSVGIILGANVGTTITAQIIAFKITKYALGMIALGFVIEVAARSERVKQYGVAFMGLGLLFFGMDLMSDAASPLRSYEPFMVLMQQIRNPILGILVGAVFTGLVQSSSATTGITIVMASEGLLSLEAGIALIFGANIGTCITAIIAAIGRPREALQAAVVHIVFNIGGVALWFGFIPQFVELVKGLSPVYAGVEGQARLALETPRQIANAHTIFNIGNALAFIWFTTPLAWVVKKIVRPRPASEDAGHPVYLDDFYLEQPAVAFDRAQLEIGRLGTLVLSMVDRSFHATTDGMSAELNGLKQDERTADQLHGAIIGYLGRLSLTDLVEPQPGQIYEYIAATNYLENASDIVGTNLVKNARKRLTAQIAISKATRETLEPLHHAVLEIGNKALKAFTKSDIEAAREVARSKASFNQLANRARTHLVKRLVAEEPERLTAFRMENDIIEDYKRLHTLFRHVAKAVEESQTIDDGPTEE